MSADTVNACFELAGSAFVLNHCRVLFKQRQVHGVSVLSAAFFLGWGFWNVLYYPSLHQWFSFAAGLSVLGANGLYVGGLLYFKRRG